MVYLEHSSSKFWRCEVEDTNVVISYGKTGTKGRTMTKEFDSEEDAEEYYDKQVATKKKGGYKSAADPGTSSAAAAKNTTPQKRKAAAKAVTPSPKKKGLGGHAAPAATTSTGVVDSGVAGIDAALASRVKVDDDYHARLALVDASKNSDKYYILQMLIDAKPPKKQKGAKKKNGPDYYVFTRWGRTGTAGQAKLDGPFDLEEEANNAFEKIFKSKVGDDWGKVVAGTKPKKNKYEYLADPATKSDDAQWYYYLQNDPMGKADGWYEYDEENSDEVEDLYGTYLAAKKPQRLSQRVVISGSSGYQYRVDLQAMQQTNTTSGTTRPIGRTVDGNEPTTIPTTTKKKAPPKPAPVPPAAAAAPATPKKNGRTPDSADSSGSVYEDYDVMLNQTNLGHNNNKFYKIQLIQKSIASWTLFTRWGRVGEPGQTQQKSFNSKETAMKEFAKKFRAKTMNDWEDFHDDPESFISHGGKYTIVEMEQDEDAANAMKQKLVKTADSELDSATKELIDLIFDEDMFKSAMQDMNIDPKKLPLGAISQNQIGKGFAVLEELEEELLNSTHRKKKQNLQDLTSQFYTLIPHAFGRKAGPVLDTMEKVKEKYDMLNTLTDIEAAQSMQKKSMGGRKKDDDDDDDEQPHPSDMNYEQLAADLTLLDTKKDKKEFKVIEKYFDDTKAGNHMKLQNVWRVNRHKEDQRFAKHDDIEERKLLWHGTNVAVVAAILKSGLRIMPHSGGRVGRGIYLADQHMKSAGYTYPAKGTTIMFLVEAALGNKHEILQDDSSLTVAPTGCQSVLAKGRTQPPNEEELEIDGKPVAVPNGKPKPVKTAGKSYFTHNEFLIYDESQHRIRYILTFGN